jgi:hypothetical protein
VADPRGPSISHGCWVLTFGQLEATVFAASNWLLVVVQIPATLPPADMNSADEAMATKASSRVYSIRPCPASSFQKLRSVVTFVHQSFVQVDSCIPRKPYRSRVGLSLRPPTNSSRFGYGRGIGNGIERTDASKPKSRFDEGDDDVRPEPGLELRVNEEPG